DQRLSRRSSRNQPTEPVRLAGEAVRYGPAARYHSSRPGAERQPVSASVIDRLSQPLRARVSTTMPERGAGARALWQRRLIQVPHGAAAPSERLPAAVAHPENSAEVAELVALARDEGLALVPFGAGSGVCGAIECGPSTIVVDTKRLRHLELT